MEICVNSEGRGKEAGSYITLETPVLGVSQWSLPRMLGKGKSNPLLHHSGHTSSVLLLLSPQLSSVPVLNRLPVSSSISRCLTIR